MKIAMLHSENTELAETLIKFCRDVIQIGASSSCLTQFIKPLNSKPGEIVNYESLARVILSSLVFLLKEPAYKEVYVFSGRASSGMGLLSRKGLPKEGFGFCGYVRLERNSQLHSARPMTVFKLGSSTNKEIELLIKDGYIAYRVHSTLTP